VRHPQKKRKEKNADLKVGRYKNKRKEPAWRPATTKPRMGPPGIVRVG